MKNLLLEKLQRGEKTVGTFFGFGNASVAEALGMTGIDFMIIDTEHGPFDVESTLEILRGGELGGTTCLVRTKNTERSSILKMLDIGAKGLIIPSIQSADDVRQIVEYGKYYPLGSRGVGWARGCQYGEDAVVKQPMEDFFRDVNALTMLIPQCETSGCLEQIEEIAAIDGVAGIFIGPFDLSCALGTPGQFDTPEFTAAIARIVKACKDAGKYIFTFTTNPADCKAYFEQGMDAVTVSMDFLIYMDAFKQMLEIARG